MLFTSITRNRTALVTGLFALIIIVMLNNYSGRSNYADLDKTISSIYQDRLVPAGYLFSISDLLHQKKMLWQQYKDSSLPKAVKSRLGQYNAALLLLQKRYDATYLTVAEKEQWGLFKALLLQYNVAEALGEKQLLQTSFDQGVTCLQRLNEIQVTEGKALQHQSRDLLGGSLLQSHFEIGLLFVVCILMLALTGLFDKHRGLSSDQALLN